MIENLDGYNVPLTFIFGYRDYKTMTTLAFFGSPVAIRIKQNFNIPDDFPIYKGLIDQFKNPGEYKDLTKESIDEFIKNCAINEQVKYEETEPEH